MYKKVGIAVTLGAFLAATGMAEMHKKAHKQPEPHAHQMHGMNFELGNMDAPSSKEYAEANRVMHRDMTFPFTGDADIDFLKGMIAHHQGAVDMARTQLKYGEDTRIRRMSYDIIRAQELEIRWMKKWLQELQENQKGFSDENWMGNHKVGGY